MKVHYVGQKKQSKVLNFAESYWFFFSCWLALFFVANIFLFIFCLTRLSPHPQRWDLKQKHFVVDIFFFFTVPICFSPTTPNEKNASTILLSIFIKISLKGRAVSDSFLGHHEQHSSQEVSSTWRRRKEKKRNADDFWGTGYCNLETELCMHWVKSGLFPVTLSLMKVAKSPGGLWCTVCLCLREHSRGTRGEARW